MLRTRLVSIIASTALLATGIAGGIHGGVLADQNATALTARENVATMVSQNLTTVDYIAGTQARATLDAFAPTIEAATALVESSAGKASDASRAALQAILAEIEVKTSAHFETGSEARETAAQIVATGTPALSAASQVVTDEVAAWQAAEDARVAAEKAAAEAAARENSQRSNNGSRNSTGSSGGSSNNGGGSNGNSGGGGSCTDRYAATAAANGARFEIIDGNTSYYQDGVIQMGRGPAGACADEVFNHELAHHLTMGSGRAGCADTSRNLNSAAGLSQRHVETWAQAYTQRHWGWSADWAYTPAPQSYVDSMVAAGCL